MFWHYKRNKWSCGKMNYTHFMNLAGQGTVGTQSFVTNLITSLTDGDGK